MWPRENSRRSFFLKRRDDRRHEARRAPLSFSHRDFFGDGTLGRAEPKDADRLTQGSHGSADA